jgi:transitional endoplasmic reticulum ATPase
MTAQTAKFPAMSVRQLNADFEARLACKRATPLATRRSSVIYLWGGRIGQIITTVNGYLFHMLPAAAAETPAWAVVAVFTFLTPGVLPKQAFGPQALTSFDAVSDVSILATYGLVLMMGLAYVIEVLMRVPLAKPLSYPLVLPVPPLRMDLFGSTLRWAGGTLVGKVVVVLALAWFAPKMVPMTGTDLVPGCLFHGSILMGLGWLFKRMNDWQPALGFIKWTLQDQVALENEEYLATKQKQVVAFTDAPEYVVPFEVCQSELTFDDIHGMQELKAKLLEPARQILECTQRNSVRSKTSSQRNGILLFGEPGNGKTVFARALAGELKVPIMEVTRGAISSQWIGNEPKVLTQTFAKARHHAPCVMFMDEIDSFLQPRDTVTHNTELRLITNTMLTEIVNLRGSGVVLVGATNYIDKLDAAAIREGRFDFKVEITSPDEAARIGLLWDGVRKYANDYDVDPEQLESVARRWNGFSAARLFAVCQALKDASKKRAFKQVGLAEWMLALREVQGRRGKVPSNVISLRDMVLPPSVRQPLELLAKRFKNVARTESLGGTLPSGVLFYGPPGTGKTAGAKSLAKESDWSFLPLSGPDLLADRGLLDRTFKDAKELRPTIIFIDEADDVLRNRQLSATPELVNKLLTLMDGTDDKVKDIVWIAATNHPEDIDPALLRAGRFTEKVMFAPPDAHQIPQHVAKFLEARNAQLGHQLSMNQLSQAMEGLSIASIDGVMQHALNIAIAREETGPVYIQPEDIEIAMRTTLT